MSKRLIYSLVHFSSCLAGIAQSQAGSTLPMLAIFIAAMLGMTALMVDVSRISTTAAEVQASADVAATAGARAQFARPQGVPLTEAQASLRSNQVDNKALTNANLTAFQLGNYNENNGSFTSNLAPTNSVRAVVQASVSNAWMPGWGDDTSTVTKTAIAAFRSIGSGNPTLPLVLGSCHFQSDCFQDSCMPRLTQVPNTTNNSAWTAFFEGNVSNTTIHHYLPVACGDGDGMSAFVSVGDYISLNNGQVNAVLKDIQDMVACGMTKFLIPIVPCPGQYNQSKQVLGFATIIVDTVVTQGGNKGITLHGIYEDSPGTVGGANFGTGTIGLVQ